MNPPIFRPAAAADVEDAYRWYEGQRAGLGDEFIAAVSTVIESLIAYPERFPVVYRQTRRANLRRFPYSLFYRIIDDQVQSWHACMDDDIHGDGIHAIMANHRIEKGAKTRLSPEALCAIEEGLMARGIFLDPGHGTIYSARGSKMAFKALHETTGGAFSFMERDLPVSNRRPQPHTHKGPEGFYVLQGSIEFIVGGESRKGGPGFWALAPSGVSHTFGNAGESPARLLIIHSPAADAYFAELEALWKDSTPTPEEERELMKRHGLEPSET